MHVIRARSGAALKPTESATIGGVLELNWLMHAAKAFTPFPQQTLILPELLN